jgi:CDP-diacylglycerol--inositol 3-phosphatidyltransferase
MPPKANGAVKTPRARRGSSISQAMSETIEKVDESLQKTENVFLFLPNLIGYARILLALGSLQYMPM